MSKRKPLILIVEDHPAVRLLLGMTLKNTYRVVTKSDGIEAMAWLMAGNEPDLIVLDMQMPRLDGFDFLKQIRLSGLFHHLNVIVVSGDPITDRNMELLDLNIADYIPKPFNPELLAERVASALRKAEERKRFALVG